MKASTSPVVVALLVGVGLLAQTPPTFEVASIRVHSFASAGPPIAGNRGTFGGNLKQLIIYAYDLKVYQLDGGPSWVTADIAGGSFSTEAAPGIERDASLRAGRWQEQVRSSTRLRLTPQIGGAPRLVW